VLSKKQYLILLLMFDSSTLLLAISRFINVD